MRRPVACLALLMASCSKAPAPAARAPAPTHVGEGFAYDVRVEQGARELVVEATLGRGTPSRLTVDDGCEPFVRGLEVLQGDRFEPASRSGDSWQIDRCERDGCRVRYRFALAEAASSLADYDRAMARGSAFVTAPSAFLLRPWQGSQGPAQLRVSLAPGVQMASGLGPSQPFSLLQDDIIESPWGAFGSFSAHHLSLGTTSIDVAFLEGKVGLPEARIVAWIQQQAHRIAAFYGRFPVKHLLVIVSPERGSGVLFGRTLGNGGASIMLHLGDSLDEADLAADWMLPHELIHLAFPTLERRHLWLEEGLSTYVEPLVRLRAGEIDEARFWYDFVTLMPQGLAQAGDRGLDHTPTWGRTYWGGAIFCLMADIELRQRTGGRVGLADVLRAVVEKGGSIAVRWSMQQVLTVADEAAGAPVLTNLYQRQALARDDVDLPALFRSLGVSVASGQTRLDDRAPLAPLRRAITAAPARP